MFTSNSEISVVGLGSLLGLQEVVSLPTWRILDQVPYDDSFFPVLENLCPLLILFRGPLSWVTFSVKIFQYLIYWRKYFVRTSMFYYLHLFTNHQRPPSLTLPSSTHANTSSLCFQRIPLPWQNTELVSSFIYLDVYTVLTCLEREIERVCACVCVFVYFLMFLLTPTNLF